MNNIHQVQTAYTPLSSDQNFTSKFVTKTSLIYPSRTSNACDLIVAGLAHVAFVFLFFMLALQKIN